MQIDTSTVPQNSILRPSRKKKSNTLHTSTSLQYRPAVLMPCLLLCTHFRDFHRISLFHHFPQRKLPFPRSLFCVISSFFTCFDSVFAFLICFFERVFSKIDLLIFCNVHWIDEKHCQQHWIRNLKTLFSDLRRCCSLLNGHRTICILRSTLICNGRSVQFQCDWVLESMIDERHWLNFEWCTSDKLLIEHDLLLSFPVITNMNRLENQLPNQPPLNLPIYRSQSLKSEQKSPAHPWNCSDPKLLSQMKSPLSSTSVTSRIATSLQLQLLLFLASAICQMPNSMNLT